MALKKQLNEIKDQSCAMEMMKDSKRTNRTIAICFSIVLVFISMFWFFTMCYLIHVLNDIEYEEITTESYDIIQDSGENGNNNFINGNGNGVNNG